jgi:hypothetical protein
LTGQVVGFADQRLALAPFSAERSAKILVIARDFDSSFASAFRSPPEIGG